MWLGKHRNNSKVMFAYYTEVRAPLRLEDVHQVVLCWLVAQVPINKSTMLIKFFLYVNNQYQDTFNFANNVDK